MTTFSCIVFSNCDERRHGELFITCKFTILMGTLIGISERICLYSFCYNPLKNPSGLRLHELLFGGFLQDEDITIFFKSLVISIPKLADFDNIVLYKSARWFFISFCCRKVIVFSRYFFRFSNLENPLFFQPF
jgi:hypothetical protein